MKAQTPAEGILKRGDWGYSKLYNVPCECSDSTHDHNVWVETDETERVNVTIYTTVKSKWWEANRWQKIWTLLTKGYVEYEATVVMTEQQALNYSETLKKAIADVKQFKKPQNSQ